MRESLTILAGLVVLVLAVALAAPWFIDWTGQRAFIEARLTQALGRRVTTEGPIDVKLLPTPRLLLGGLSVEGPVALAADGARIEFALTPLLRGETHIVEAVFTRPRVDIADGAALGPPGGASLSIESLVLDDASLAIHHAGLSTTRLEHVTLQAQVAALAGPYKGNGTLALDQGPVTFRFSTGVAGGGQMRLKIVADESAVSPRADLDGALIVEDGGTLRFDGTAGASGQTLVAGTPVPWQATGAVKGNAREIAVDGLQMRIDADDRALNLTGSGSARLLPAPSASLAIAARQVDLDRLLGQPGDAVSAPARLQELLARALALPATTGLPLSLSFTSPTLALGGQSLTDISASADRGLDGTTLFKLDTSAPGRASLALEGKIETGQTPTLQGRVRLAVRDWPRFAESARAMVPGLGPQLAAAPWRVFDAAGDVQLSSVGLSMRDLVLKIDRSVLNGQVSISRAVAQGRAKLTVDLDSPAFDVDGAPDLSGASGLLADTDLSVALSARAVRVARVGQGMIDAGRISLKGGRTGSDWSLERLSIAGLGGASVSATGNWSGSAGKLETTVDAARLVDLAELVRRIAPGALADAFVARAVALSPAKLALTAELSSAGAGVSAARLGLEGQAGMTKISLQVTPDPVDALKVTAALSLDAPEAGALLRQLGASTLPLTGLGRGRIDARAQGRLDATLQATMDAQVAGTRTTFTGRLTPSGAMVDGQGSFTLASPDVSPLLQILAIALPDATAKLPATLAGDIGWTARRLAVPRLAGQVAGSGVLGDLALTMPEATGGARRAALSGALAFDRLSLSSLTGLALGPVQPARTGSAWSDLRFGAGLADPPPARVALRIARFDLTDTLAARDGALTLAITPGAVTLDAVDARLGAGRVGGNLTLRRDGATASLSGNLKMTAIEMRQSALGGIVSGALDFSATGDSAAALAGGMAGAGTVTIDGLKIERAGPTALKNVFDQVEAEKLSVDEKDIASSLGLAFDAGALDLGATTFDAGLAAGLLRLTPPAGTPERAVAGAVTVQPQIGLDLKSSALDARLAMTLTAVPKDWVGALPQVRIGLRGPLAAPRRELETGGFVAGLAARAIARDTARIEALEADIRERAFFNRRRKSDEFLARRAVEIQQFLDEEARRAAAEEQRRVAEEARLKAEEDKRAADEARRQSLEQIRLEREKALAEARRLMGLDPLPGAPQPAPPTASATPPAPPAPAAPRAVPVEIAPKPDRQAPPVNTPDPSTAGKY